MYYDDALRLFAIAAGLRQKLAQAPGFALNDAQLSQAENLHGLIASSAANPGGGVGGFVDAAARLPSAGVAPDGLRLGAHMAPRLGGGAVGAGIRAVSPWAGHGAGVLGAAAGGANGPGVQRGIRLQRAMDAINGVQH